MSRTGANIYKRKDGRFEARFIKDYAESGKAVYGYLYARSYAEVKDKLCHAVLLANQKGGTPLPSPTFGKVAEDWLEDVKRRSKISTFCKYCNMYRRHIEPFWATRRFADITPETAEDFLRFLRAKEKENGLPLSQKTVSDVCMAVKQIFLFAEDHFQAEPPFPLRKLRVVSESKEISVLSEAEAQALYRYLLQATDRFQVGVLLSLCTGIRIGELCALRREDISLSDGTLHIDKTAQRIQTFGDGIGKTCLVVSSAKSRCSNRTIPIPKALMQVVSLSLPTDGYFLTGSEKIPEPRMMQSKFRKYCQSAGIPPYSFHALRHTFASRCVEFGGDIKTVSEILGHSSVNITLNRYVHSSMKMKRSVMDEKASFSLSPSKK